MPTFKEAIEGRIGTYTTRGVSDTLNINTWLKQGARELIELIPDPERYSTSINATGGFSLAHGRFLGCNVGGYPTIEWTGNSLGTVSDSNSIFRAINTSSVHIKTKDTVYVVGNDKSLYAFTVVYIPYPNFVYTDDIIASVGTNFPRHLIEGVVLYVSVQAKQKILVNHVTSYLEPLVYIMQTKPIFNGVIDYAWVNAVLAEIAPGVFPQITSAPTTNLTLTALPSFAGVLNIPAFDGVKPSVPDLSTITGIVSDDLSVTIPEFTDTLSVSIPGTPIYSAPSIDITDVTIPDLTVNEIVPILDTLDPGFAAYILREVTQNVTTLHTNLTTSLETLEDIEKAQAAIERLQNMVSTYSAEYNIRLQKFLNESNILNDVAKTNVVNKVQIFSAKYSMLLEQYKAKISYYNMILSNAQGEYNVKGQIWAKEADIELQTKLAVFNANLDVWKTESGVALERVKTLLQKFQILASTDLEIQKTNALQILQLFDAELKGYQTDAEVYAQRVNAEVMAYKAKLDQWQVECANIIQRDKDLIALELAEFQAEVAKWQLTNESAIKQVELQIQVALANSQNTKDIEMFNKSKLWETELNKIKDYLTLYGLEIQKYQIAVQEENFRFNSLMTKYIQEHTAYASQLELLKREYNELIQKLIGGK